VQAVLLLLKKEVELCKLQQDIREQVGGGAGRELLTVGTWREYCGRGVVGTVWHMHASNFGLLIGRCVRGIHTKQQVARSLGLECQRTRALRVGGCTRARVPVKQNCQHLERRAALELSSCQQREE